ncbi:hypothetical protein [Schleiferia thermophila]|jgi:hypothetical protein|uniref:hypothetical protein n=1 Tax=Schleiferia thermophila TaxID=884107 RepID=UPI00068AB6F9|nr:hypothetical protein [Schleiferia thermophila]
MKNIRISAFTFLRNAVDYDLPFVESISSALPIVDEYIVALAHSSDATEEKLLQIETDKLKIISTDWIPEVYTRNTEYARQTDLAKAHCTGHWLLYLQGDEVLHEEDHSKIMRAIRKAHEHRDVEGILFNFLHFWADYRHVHRSHTWYKKEIRLIRNLPEIHSWRDAQSFRFFHIPPKSPADYLSKHHSRKLRVIDSSIRIFHYGHVKKIELQHKKVQDAANTFYQNKKTISFDFGNIHNVPLYIGTHPAVMKDRIAEFEKNQAHPSFKNKPNPKLHKHERLKYRLLSWVENTFFGGRQLFGFKNFTLLSKACELKEKFKI